MYMVSRPIFGFVFYTVAWQTKAYLEHSVVSPNDWNVKQFGYFSDTLIAEGIASFLNFNEL